MLTRKSETTLRILHRQLQCLAVSHGKVPFSHCAEKALTCGMLLGVDACSEKTVSRLPRAAGIMLAPERMMRPSSRLLCSSRLQKTSTNAWPCSFLPWQNGAMQDCMMSKHKCCCRTPLCHSGHDGRVSFSRGSHVSSLATMCCCVTRLCFSNIAA